MRKSFLFFIISIYSCLPVFSQEIDSMMSVYAERTPREKIHIHFDRDIYNPEETIFYKIYLLSGNQLSELSKNMYVEWYDTTGTLIKQTIAPLFLSGAAGSFEIPKGYKGNYLRLKAFTRWMLNEENETDVYEKLIPLNLGTNSTQKLNINKTNLSLFPEGGYLVEGISSRVAFKATNNNGLPVKVSGFVRNSKNEVVDSIVTIHDGMGLFLLNPAKGEQYRVEWTDEFKQKYTTPITQIQSAGAVMLVRTSNDKASVTIQRSANTQGALQQYTLMVHMNQEPLFKVAIKMTERMLQRAEIPIDQMPTGILQFTLFNSEGQPVAERIIFVNNHLHEFNAKVNPIYTSLDKRGKNSLDIVVTDTAMSNLSVAIIDAGIAAPERTNIYTDFLLSNEIKGYIHNPAYYFTSDADVVTSKLDLVMMTSGWRRYNWDKLKSGIQPVIKYLPETENMQIKGNVFGMKEIGAQQLVLNTILLGKDSSKQFLFLPVNKDGSFIEPGIFFYDTAKVYYNFNASVKGAERLQVKFDNGFFRRENGFKTTPYTGVTVFPDADSLWRVRMNYFLAEQERIRKLQASTNLQEVIVKAKVKTPLQIMDEKYARGLFAGSDAYSFDLVNDKFVPLDIFSYLQGRVPGLQISGMGAQASLSWRGATPQLFLDEMPTDVNMISGIPVQQVAYIKVFRPPFFGAIGGGAGGAIAIYTKKGDDGKKVDYSGKGMSFVTLAGFSRFKEFYNPVYDKTNNSLETDLRNTLYWNPNVFTNKKSPRFKIDFYNNDVSKKLLLILEGINADGKMTRVVKTIE
ncbi:MAG: hypothetical protein IKD55_10270 [Sediminibacterium sp.]|nr:hypothetical protein [Sediminibacterium sp.]MBX9781520.1 hypothetical protein [Chitinophagaceae bacterium]